VRVSRRLIAAPDVDTKAREAAAAILRVGSEIIWWRRRRSARRRHRHFGSGPAYVFYFLEALEQAARELGFSAADARRLSYATFTRCHGAGAEKRGEPAALRAQVTSKGGTTERALATLEANRVKASIIAAVKDAAKRARELGDEFGKEE